MFDLATFAEVEALKRRTHALRRIEYVPASRVVTVRRNGWMVVRVLGAGGSSGSAYGHNGGSSQSGNSGTVGLSTVRVAKGSQYVVTVPAGGDSSQIEAGVLTVTGPGVNITVPGGKIGGAVNSHHTNANTPPSGLDTWFPGEAGRADRSPTLPRRFWGLTAREVTAALLSYVSSDERPWAHVPAEACILLLPCLQFGRPSGFGNKGIGVGGSGHAASGTAYATGGGAGFVTLEFLEDSHD